jgi:hypothetical protein
MYAQPAQVANRQPTHERFLIALELHKMQELLQR